MRAILVCYSVWGQNGVSFVDCQVKLFEESKIERERERDGLVLVDD